jgi:hypothetical protein
MRRWCAPTLHPGCCCCHAGRLPLPTLPPPPVFLPGRGLMSAEAAVDMLAPPLGQGEVIYLQSLQVGCPEHGAGHARLRVSDASRRLGSCAGCACS